MNLEERLVDAFGSEHPRELARRIEGADPEQVATLLSSISVPIAARVVTHAVPLAVTEALAHLPADRAGAVLAQLHPLAIAGLMLRSEPGARERLLTALPRATAESVRRLLAYPQDSVGSRTDPRTPAMLESRTVDDAIALVRKSPDGALYYLYVIDERHRLAGVLNLRELMSAVGTELLSEIMVREPERVRANDSIETLIRHPAWRKVHALPVVDEGDRLLGAIRYSTFRGLEAEVGRALSGRAPSKTADALAELLWLGASAALRTAEAALVGPGRSGKEATP